ncbi:hypothetical protein ACFVWR_13560 [Leifsonia sp. NPDC058292]|uniref:hypothetical protein n=1 Tax=Leifsonia sp. NPDC058292 TaxID=3346428 RepID=UPI0036DC80B4
MVNTSMDKFLAIQRPAVIAHLRSIRRRHPQATPAELTVILQRRYLAAVTTGGAAVGVTAVIPAIGTGITLALSGVETVAFLEATALYAQSLSELHGIAVDDPERARALVLTMMLGKEGSDLVRQLAGQLSGSGAGRSAYWGEMVTASLPAMVVGPLVDRLKSAFIRQFAIRGGTSMVARAIPFGVGAVIGGAGNNILGRRVVQNSRLAFGPAPLEFAAALTPAARTVRVRPEGGNIARRSLSATADGARRLGTGAGGAASRAGRVVLAALPHRRNAETDGTEGTELNDAAPADTAPDSTPPNSTD